MLVLFNSCKAFKTLTAKDNSSPNTSSAAAANNKSISFLDDISVTPGTSNEPARPGKNKKPAKGTDVNTEPPKTIHAVTLGNSGNTNPAVLQLKYSALLDVGPEQLTNMQLLQAIDHWWGTKYCYGGQTNDCIDCSGFTQVVFMEVYGIHVPRVAQDQYDSSEHIKDKALSEGDLVFFHTTGRGKSITHVGVYITNNRFAHAATEGGVSIASLEDPYWKQKYRGAGRVIGK